MKVAKAIGAVTALAILSKLLGFAREMAIARQYGASVATDAYRIAQGVPSLLFSCIGAALATVLVPVLTRELKKGEKVYSRELLGKLATPVIVLAFLVTVIGMYFSPAVVRLVAPGFRGEAYQLSVSLTRIMFPGVALTVIAFLCAGVLQSLGEFTVPALMGIPMNLIILIGVLGFGQNLGIWALAWATMGGMAGQVLVQIPSMRKMGIRFKWRLDLKDPIVRQIGVLIIPVVLGTGVIQLNSLVAKMFASTLPEGSISVFEYSSRLTGLVVGVVISSVTIVALTKFSQVVSLGAGVELREKAERALSALNALTLPLAVVLMVLRTPIVRFVYERGAFTHETTVMTANVLLFASMGLVFSGMRQLSARVFYAMKDTLTPMVNGAIDTAANIGLLILFVGRLKLGVVGMAMASSFSTICTGTLLVLLLRIKLGGLGLLTILDSLWRSALAAVMMSLAMALVFPVLTRLTPGSGFLAQGLELCLTIGVGGLIYIGVLTLLRAREAQDGWSMVRRFKTRFTARVSAAARQKS